MQSWFFCIIKCVSVSRFMVHKIHGLWALALVSVLTSWPEQSQVQLVVGVSVRCCQIVVRSLSDRCRCVLSCSRSVLLVPESEFRRAALSLILCRWPEQSQVQLVVGVSVRCCQIVVRSLSDRCRCVLSCSRSVLLVPESEFAGLLCLWFSVADQSSRRCSSWLVFLCGVVRSLSDRCQIAVARVLSCSRSVLLAPESEFRRAALYLFLCRWPEQSQVQLVVGVSVRCCQIVVRSLSDRCRCVLSCSRSVLLVPESEFRRAALSLILCRWPEQSQVQLVVGVSVRCCQIVVRSLSDRCCSCPVLFSVSPPSSWVWVSPGCSVSVSLSLTRAVAGAARGWCFCAVLSDRCQIVVRSLSLCPVLFSVTPPCTWVWVSPGCSVSVSLSLTRAVAGAARGWCFCAVLSDRCCSCPVLFSGLSLSFTGPALSLIPGGVGLLGWILCLSWKLCTAGLSALLLWL